MPKIFKKLFQWAAKFVVWTMTGAALFLSLAVHAQALMGVQVQVFDFCGLSRMLTREEKAPAAKGEDKAIPVAVATCELYTLVESRDCIEKESGLEEVKDKLRQKPRTEYSLAKALAELSSLSVRLGAEGGCTPHPQPQKTPLDDPYNVRKRSW